MELSGIRGTSYQSYPSEGNKENGAGPVLFLQQLHNIYGQEMARLTAKDTKQLVSEKSKMPQRPYAKVTHVQECPLPLHPGRATAQLSKMPVPEILRPATEMQNQKQSLLPRTATAMQSSRQPFLPRPATGMQSAQQPLLPRTATGMQNSQQPLLPLTATGMQNQKLPHLARSTTGMQNQKQSLLLRSTTGMQNQKQPLILRPSVGETMPPSSFKYKSAASSHPLQPLAKETRPNLTLHIDPNEAPFISECPSIMTNRQKQLSMRQANQLTKEDSTSSEETSSEESTSSEDTSSEESTDEEAYPDRWDRLIDTFNVDVLKDGVAYGKRTITVKNGVGDNLLITISNPQNQDTESVMVRNGVWRKAFIPKPFFRYAKFEELCLVGGEKGQGMVFAVPANKWTCDRTWQNEVIQRLIDATCE